MGDPQELMTTVLTAANLLLAEFDIVESKFNLKLTTLKHRRGCENNVVTDQSGDLM